MAPFGSSYDKLAPQQQELVKRWISEYETITQRRLEPKGAYDNLSLSTRTTFDAVTSALLKTALTDANTGEPMGNALDLVQLVESVHGEIKGSRGDEQFRVYVLLADDALAKLYRCKQFKRTGDNTIYHIGYPINFRQQGGTPSLQFSVTRTGYRADIDVDYRSSSGPVALVNGHLTSANSDVRAGGNYFRHVHRWFGLEQWWKGLLGPQLTIPRQQVVALSSGNTPPRLTTSVPVQDAVNDFFQAFLVEGKPEVALSYISVKALPCVAEFASGESAADGLVRLRIYKHMKAISDAVGGIKSLDQILQGVQTFPEGSTPIQQPYGRVFAMASLPNKVARQLDCRVRLNMKLAEELPRSSGSDYYGAATILWNKEHTKGRVITGVWTREAKAWKLVSWQIEDPFTSNQSPQFGEVEPAPQPLAPLPPAEPALQRTAATFLSEWLLKKEYTHALSYFAPESLPCADVEEAHGAAHALPRERTELRTWLTQIGSAVGRESSLDALIRPSPFDSAQMQEVEQPDNSGFLLVRLPDYLVHMGTCKAQESREAVDRTVGIGPPTFDLNIYRVAFYFRKGGGASLTFDFAQRDAVWKIVAFDEVTD
jgi:hypothetical protein